MMNEFNEPVIVAKKKNSKVLYIGIALVCFGVFQAVSNIL